MAHAIHGYPGACKNIHGHSYELHVTLTQQTKTEGYLPAPGFYIDFKEIKKLVNSFVIDKLDHKVVLSHQYLLQNPSFFTPENLVTWKVEPTAENLLVYISKQITRHLPTGTVLARLKLFETKDSYAEWTNSNIFKAGTATPIVK